MPSRQFYIGMSLLNCMGLSYWRAMLPALESEPAWWDKHGHCISLLREEFSKMVAKDEQ